jgi:hypothetical protein
MKNRIAMILLNPLLVDNIIVNTLQITSIVGIWDSISFKMMLGWYIRERLTQIEGLIRVMIRLDHSKLIHEQHVLGKVASCLLGGDLTNDISACPCSCYIVQLVTVPYWTSAFLVFSMLCGRVWKYRPSLCMR